MVLRAADLYWSYPGERRFSVSANGAPALTDYDVIAEAGKYSPGAATYVSAPLSASQPAPCTLPIDMLNRLAPLFDIVSWSA